MNVVSVDLGCQVKLAVSAQTHTLRDVKSFSPGVQEEKRVVMEAVLENSIQNCVPVQNKYSVLIASVNGNCIQS